jgi:hypothetical protein
LALLFLELRLVVVAMSEAVLAAAELVVTALVVALFPTVSSFWFSLFAAGKKSSIHGFGEEVRKDIALSEGSQVVAIQTFTWRVRPR